MTSRRLFGDAAAGEGAVVSLDGDALRHAKVLRLRPGAQVELFDGAGRLAEAELLEGGRARIVRAWTADPSSPHLTLVWAMPKASAVDVGVRMATELGVDVIRFAIGQRSPAEPSPKKMERWERIAREATRQCERPIAPELVAPRPLGEAAATGADLRFAAVARQPATSGPGRRAVSAPAGPAAAIAVAIGPEGGFTDTERELLVGLGYGALSLGRHVLRSETAVAAALACLAAR